jgi:hypothetical protein
MEESARRIPLESTVSSVAAAEARGATPSAGLPPPRELDLSGLLDSLPPEVKEITSIAQTAASLFSTAGTAVKVITTLLSFIGVLNQTSDQQQILQAIQQLSNQLNMIAGDLTWQKSESDREMRLGNMIASVLSAGEAVKLNQPVPTTSSIAGDSVQASTNAEDPIAFQRFFQESVTDGPWKKIIPDRPPVSNGFVYDWRLGIPALMQLISLRLQVIAAEDANFTTDQAFHDELMHYRNTLQTHMQNMRNEVRCNTKVRYYSSLPLGSVIDHVDFEIGCADINTGLSQTQSVVIGTPGQPLPPPFDQGESCCHFVNLMQVCDQQCQANDQAQYQSYYNANIQPIQDSLYRQVLYAMPLFDMQALSDALYGLANGIIDWSGPEHFSVGAGECLADPNGSTTNGTQLWLQPCARGDSTQMWLYDRHAQTLVQSSSNKCLDVRGVNMTPGTPAQIWDCVGNDAQRWTYDYESHVLTNALGNVLDGFNLQTGTGVITWPRNAGVWQQWTPYVDLVRIHL